MEFHFQSSTCSCLPKLELGSGCKFVARFLEFLPSDSNRWLVEDRQWRAVVDTSTLENVVCEPGEWYRFMGEVAGDVAFGTCDLPMIKLHVHPRACDGFEGEISDRALHLRSEFLQGFDSLVAYAYRNR